jgi:hypothetical protein
MAKPLWICKNHEDLRFLCDYSPEVNLVKEDLIIKHTRLFLLRLPVSLSPQPHLSLSKWLMSKEDMLLDMIIMHELSNMDFHQGQHGSHC